MGVGIPAMADDVIADSSATVLTLDTKNFNLAIWIILLVDELCCSGIMSCIVSFGNKAQLIG